MTALIPWPYRWFILGLLLVAAVAFGWAKAADHYQGEIDAMVGKAAVEGARIVVARGEVTTRIETKYLPAIERQHVITETVIKEVPVYVASTDPDLPPGFRVLHDASATGRVPDPADKLHAAAVPAQDAAATITENYGLCRENFLKLEGLQEWITQQQKVR